MKVHFSAIGVGGNCRPKGSAKNGRHEVDLSGTMFRFAPDVQMVFIGWNAETIASIFNNTYSYLEGSGSCGLGHAQSISEASSQSGKLYDSFIPLVFY